MDKPAEAYLPIPSKFGRHILIWRDAPGLPKVIGIILARERRAIEEVLRERYPHAAAGKHPVMSALRDQLVAFLRGEAIRFSLDLLDFKLCSGFQRRVLRGEAKIPRGRVSTYGRLARKIRAPGAARAVGTALARNPFPLVIPCHRCVREDGRLGGFQGGQPMKRALLEMEGIDFDEVGRIKREFI
ncbi:methylated-DNA--[protein]-cysteine S-methyltransferase [Candidatus Zixiibacteriota bacterium]